MRIAIISDTHDNIWRLAEALPTLATCDAVLHCGDLISPFVIERLAEGLAGTPVHIVWGNNDGDRHTLTRKADQADHIHLHGEFAELSMGDLSVAVNHYPAIARAAAASGGYDLVCYGHDHTAHDERVGECLLLNPGEIMGLNGPSSFAIYSSETGDLERVTVPPMEGTGR